MVTHQALVAAEGVRVHEVRVQLQRALEAAPRAVVLACERERVARGAPRLRHVAVRRHRLLRQHREVRLPFEVP